MSLTITDERITSDLTSHSAELLDNDSGGWIVSWLYLGGAYQHAGRLTRDQAAAAINIAEHVQWVSEGRKDNTGYYTLATWCEELDLTPERAIAMVKATR